MSPLHRLVCVNNLLAMATESAYPGGAYPGGDPRGLLSTTHELTQRVRRAQRATWFPLLVLAAVTFASIPAYRYFGHHRFGSCTPVVAPAAASATELRTACAIYPNGEFVYWPFALVLAYAVIAVFYIRRSRALGLETRVRPYAVAGVVIAVALTVVMFWELHSPSAAGPAGLHALGWRLVNPTSAVGIALLVLARAERNRALLAVAVAYLAVVLIPVDFGWAMDPRSPWYFVPRLVIDGGVLLLGGIGFALAQQPPRSRAA